MMRVFGKGIVVLVVFVALINLTGCVTTFTPSGQFQVSTSAAANDTAEVLADFEASEASGFAGDVTKKAGSSCANGVCTIY
jgi:hypothetical protein